MSSSSSPHPEDPPAVTPALKWKFWVVCQTPSMGYQPIVCIEQDLKPGVNPPFSMGQFAKFTGDRSNKCNMRSEVLAFSNLWSQAMDQKLPAPKALLHFPYTTTAVLDAMCFYPLAGNEQIFSAVVLDPSTAFGPHDNRISFGVIDITEQVVSNSWAATLWHQHWVCFTFPFGMHKQDLSPRMQGRMCEPLSATDYVDVFRGEIDIPLKRGHREDYQPREDDHIDQTLELVGPVLSHVWPVETFGVSWLVTGPVGRKHYTEFPDRESEMAHDFGDGYWDPDFPNKYIDDDRARDLGYHPELILEPKGAKLLAKDMFGWILDLATPGLLKYLETKEHVTGVLSSIDEAKRVRVEAINLSVLKVVDTDLLAWLPRWFPNLKHIMLMHGDRTLTATKCFEVLEKSLASQMKIYRINHQDLYMSSLINAPQIRNPGDPYVPILRAKTFGQVTQIIFTTLRTRTSTSDKHDWPRLKSGGLDWDHILRKDNAHEENRTPEHTFWACIPCREADMRGANWLVWWPKLMYFFQNKRVCDPYDVSSSDDTSSRRRFLEAFSYSMSHPLPKLLRGAAYMDHDQMIQPLPLGPYQQAADMKNSSSTTDIQMPVESLVQEGAYTLVIVAEDIDDDDDDRRVLRYGFVTSASPATEANPIKVLSLDSFCEATNAPMWYEEDKSRMVSQKYYWPSVHEHLKMSGLKHVCALREVESVLGRDLSRYFVRTVMVDHLGRIVD